MYLLAPQEGESVNAFNTEPRFANDFTYYSTVYSKIHRNAPVTSHVRAVIKRLYFLYVAVLFATTYLQVTSTSSATS